MILKEIIEKPTFSFDDLFEKDVKLHSFEIDCSLLKFPQYEHYFDAYGENQMFNLIESLKEIDKPCLYWFEAENEEKASNLILALNDFRLNNPKNRTIPAKNRNINSKCIYVGIRQAGKRKDGFTNIAGRMVIHFGYYKVPSTQGLQLVYWAKEKIKLTVMELPSESSIFLNVLEKELAKKLKPLCGRH